MASASDIRAGAAYVELYVKNMLGDPLKKAGGQVQAFGLQVAALGSRIFAASAAAAAALAGLGSQFAQLGTSLERASQQTGVSVEALSELQYVAEQAGLTFQDLTALFKGQDNFLQQVRFGSEEAIRALVQMGVRFAELRGLSPEQIMQRLADGISRIQDPAQRAAVAMKVFGEAGLKAMPMFVQGAAGIERMREEARAFGLQVSTTDARAALALMQAWNRAWAQIRAVIFALGAGLAPVLKSTLEVVTGLLTGIVKWVQENRTLVQVVLALTVGIGAAAAAMVTFGVAIIAAGAAMAAIGTAVAFLVSPLGIVIGLVGGLAYAFRNDLADAASPAIEAAGRLLGEWQSTLGAIVALISLGDLEGAWELVTLELFDTWQRVVDLMEDAWTYITDLLEDVWDSTVGEITQRWEEFKDRFHIEIETSQNVWQGFCESLAEQFASAFERISQTWDEFKERFSNEINFVRDVFVQMVIELAGAWAHFMSWFEDNQPGALDDRPANQPGPDEKEKAAGEFLGIGQQLNPAQRRDQARRQRQADRDSRDIGRDFQRMTDEELRRQEINRRREEAERRRNDALWTEAIGRPGESPRNVAQELTMRTNGSFNAFALDAGLGRNDFQRRTAENTQRMVELQADLRQLLEQVLEYSA